MVFNALHFWHVFKHSLSSSLRGHLKKVLEVFGFLRNQGYRGNCFDKRKHTVENRTERHNKPCIKPEWAPCDEDDSFTKKNQRRMKMCSVIRQQFLNVSVKIPLFKTHSPLKKFWGLQVIFMLPKWCCLFINWQCENQTIALSNERYFPITNTFDVLESIIKLPGSLDMWKVSIYMASDTSPVVEQEKKNNKKKKTR